MMRNISPYPKTEKDIEMEITVEPRYQSTNESFHPNEYKYSVDFSVDGTNGHNRACILKCLCSNCKWGQTA